MDLKKSENETLLIRHLPKCFTDDDCIDFFKQFGAIKVKYLGQKGILKHAAFVTFKNAQEATINLNRLHQLSFLDTTLVVEYSKSSDFTHSSNEGKCITFKENDDLLSKQVDVEHEKNILKDKFFHDLNSISGAWNFGYGFKSDLYYSYPSPSVSILINITNALASVPRFYTQVLHLMNKMNLPAPFGPLTLTPPILDDTMTYNAKELRLHKADTNSDPESEFESDDEKLQRKKALKRKRDESSYDVSLRKRFKLQLMMESQLQSISSKPSANPKKPEDVFESHEAIDKCKKIDIKISSTASGAVDQEPPEKISGDNEEVTSGFGKLFPEAKKPEDDALVNTPNDWEKQYFMSKEDIAKNQMTLEQLEKLSAFKNYNAGEPSSRLYIKNLSKTVTEDDLHFVFGNFVNWDKEEERQKYDISLMKQGRMKGQAFVTFSSEDSAKEAVRDTNGLVLLGKPIAVHFARSAK